MQIGFRLCEGVLRSNRETEWMFILRTMYPGGLNRKGGGGGRGGGGTLKDDKNSKWFKSDNGIVGKFFP